MASRRGLAVTAGILGAVTAASFAVWLVPQGYDSPSFVVTDHAAHLDGVKNIHATIAADLDGGYARLLAGEIRADEYAVMAEASSEQVRSLIIDTVSADPPAEWQESYSAYVEALRQYNTYIRETVAAAAGEAAAAGAASPSGGQGDAEGPGQAGEEASRYRDAADALAARSDQARPGP